MGEQPDERIDELIALAALGEISEAEETELDSLLASDDALRDDVDETMEVAATLLASRSDDPPARLKSSILDAIATTPQVSAGAASAHIDSVGVDTNEGADVIDLSTRRRRRWVSALSAAAALVLLAGVGIVVTREDTVSVDEQIAQDAAVVVDADDAVSRELEGELEGTVRVIYSPGEAALVIDGDGLPVLGEDRAFVLWFVSDDGATPVQIFQPDESGDVLVRVDDVDPTDFTLGITEEDSGGAETPTEPILALA